MSDALPPDPFESFDRLHPEGAPGVAQNMLRAMIGDEAFEERQQLQRDRNDYERRHAQLHELSLIGLTMLYWSISIALLTGSVIGTGVALAALL